MTWGDLRRSAQAGDAEAAHALREYGAEMAELVAGAHSASQHARSELERLGDEIDAAQAAASRRKDRRERAMLAMTAVSVLAAVVAVFFH